MFFPKFKNICGLFALTKLWWFESTASEFADFPFFLTLLLWVYLPSNQSLGWPISMLDLSFCNLPAPFCPVKKSKVKLCLYWDSKVLESVLFLSFWGNGYPWGTDNTYLSCMIQLPLWHQHGHNALCSVTLNVYCEHLHCDLTVAGKEQMPLIFVVVKLCTEHNKWIKFSRRLRP